MQLTKIEEAFRHRARIHGGVFLLDPAGAMEFVEACHKAGIAICGLEGFLLIGERIQPVQEQSVDYVDSSRGNHAEALAFLASRMSQEFWFEVVPSDRT